MSLPANLATILAAAASADPSAQNTNLYIAWHQLDNLMEKLKLLDYERQLMGPMNLQPLPRHYFDAAHNSGEQFYVFQSLCAWLIRRTGRDFEQPQEFHDPNQTIAALLRVLQELNISTDFPTSHLMRGAGLVCAHVLDALATQALSVQRARLARPEVRLLLAAEEMAPDADAADDEDVGEIILERLEEEQLMAMHSDGDDDDDGIGVDAVATVAGELGDLDAGVGGILDLRPARQVHKSMEAKGARQGESAAVAVADGESWRLELERVLPQLKVVVRADARDWRAHWEQMRTLKGSINAISADTLAQLGRLSTDITNAFDKISSREQHLNTNLAPLIAQHKAISIELAELRAALDELDTAKVGLDRQTARLDEEFTVVRAQMEQRGTAMSDGTPLINIKKAAQRVRDELVEMELEIAVLRHTVDQDVMKRNAMYSELAAEMGGQTAAGDELVM